MKKIIIMNSKEIINKINFIIDQTSRDRNLLYEDIKKYKMDYHKSYEFINIANDINIGRSLYDTIMITCALLSNNININSYYIIISVLNHITDLLELTISELIIKLEYFNTLPQEQNYMVDGSIIVFSIGNNNNDFLRISKFMTTIINSIILFKQNEQN